MSNQGLTVSSGWLAIQTVELSLSFVAIKWQFNTVSHTTLCYHRYRSSSRTPWERPFVISFVNRVSLLMHHEHSRPTLAETSEVYLFNLELLFCFHIWSVCGCLFRSLRPFKSENKATKLQSDSGLLSSCLSYSITVPNCSMISGLAKVLSHPERDKTSTSPALSPPSRSFAEQMSKRRLKIFC